METEWLAAYLALGAFVGFFAGLFGVGGGAIMVPLLTTLFVLQGFPSEYIVHSALATSMAAIIITSLSSLRAHHKHQAVLWKVVYGITPGILVGTMGAAFLASMISSRALAIFFTVFMIFVSIQMLLNIKPRPSRQLSGPVGLSLAGTVIGGISALVAIGGGSMTVPYLTWSNVKVHRAIGTSAAVGFPIAVAGTAGYLISGWGVAGLPGWTWGYVYLPAVILISVVSFMTAPFGAKLAHKLPIPVLKKLFAVMLLLLCAKMLYSVYTV